MDGLNLHVIQLGTWRNTNGNDPDIFGMFKHFSAMNAFFKTKSLLFFIKKSQKSACYSEEANKNVFILKN